MDDLLLILLFIVASIIMGLIIIFSFKRIVRSPAQPVDVSSINNAITALNTSIVTIPNTVSTMQKGIQDNLNTSLQGFSSSVTTLTNTVQSLQSNLTGKVDGMQQTVTADLQSRLATVADGLENLRKNLDENITPKLNQLDGSQHNVQESIQTFVALFSGSTRTKGVAGEAAIRMILKSLPSSLWSEQVSIPGTTIRVDFAINVPRADGSNLMLPIDSKFSFPSMPEKEMSADEQKEYEKNSNKMVDARSIEVSKYVDPTKNTTNFALMFVPDAVYQMMTQETLKSVIARNVIPVNTPGLVASAFILSRFSKEVECARDTQQIMNSIVMSSKTLTEAINYIDKAKKQLMSADKNLDIAEKKVEVAKDQLSVHNELDVESN